MIAPRRASFAFETIGFTLLGLVLVSPVWFETDAYRYAALALFAYGTFRYWSAADKPAIGWAGYLCLGWSLYVAVRYAIHYALYPDGPMGSSEGIYLFPFVYSTIGYALYLQPSAVRASIRLFVPISLVMLASTVRIDPPGDREIYSFLVTNNTIHSSVCAGFIAFAALNLASFIWRTQAPGPRRAIALIAAYAVIVLCAIGIYWARSRGVWVAIGIAIVAQLLISIAAKPPMRAIAIGVAMIGALGAFLVTARADLWAKVGPSLTTAWNIAAEIGHSGSILDALRHAIASGTVPANMAIRLKLWSNALESWSHDYVFGSGIGWETAFREASFGNVGFNLLHNGYLEVAVRYGLLGLAFYAVLYSWAIVQSVRAHRAGLIAREAFVFHLVALVFFLTTILTNSNNRLAIGESYMLVAASFGFFCNFRLQRSVAGTKACAPVRAHQAGN